MIATLLLSTAPVLLFAGAVGTNPTTRMTWTLATERVDGTPLELSKIASTRIEYGPCDINGIPGPVLTTLEIPSPQTEATFVVTTEGQYCFRAYTVLFATDANGDPIKSAPSNTLTKEIIMPPPMPPVVDGWSVT